MSWRSAVHSGNSCRLTNPRWEKHTHTHRSRSEDVNGPFFCWHGWRQFWISKGRFPHRFWVILDRIHKRNSNWGCTVLCFSYFRLPSFTGVTVTRTNCSLENDVPSQPGCFLLGRFFGFGEVELKRSEKIWWMLWLCSSRYPCGN